MSRPTKRAIVDAVMARHGRTYAEELGIPVHRDTPSALFRLVCAALLFSARIRASVAVAAADALKERGWTSARKMAAATWEDRTRVLNRSGYARYDERTSTMLGQTADLLIDRWGGDLRRLRAEADREPRRERALLKECPGIGDVGVDIFFREVQVAWDELFPFADERALGAAKRLGLGATAGALAKLVDRGQFARLVAALVRVELEKDYEAVLAEASGG
jgi:hypothetical protein